MDVILAWPRNCDYPLYRDFLHNFRHFFTSVIIVFTETNEGEDYKEFIREQMKDDKITFMDSRPIQANEDWRDVAVNQALEVSKAEWVWFTEQDFFVLGPDFWAIVGGMLKANDAVGYKDGATRMHPSCLFVKREWIDKTGKNFGIEEGKSDHFAKFYTSLRLSGAKIGHLPAGNWMHMNGLSHNMYLLANDRPIIYKPTEFEQYLALCYIQKDVQLDPRFKKLVEDNYETETWKPSETTETS